MIAIIKNNLNRLKEQKKTVSLIVLLSILSVLIALIITKPAKYLASIAYVGNKDIISSEHLDIDYYDTMPNKSLLLANRYDAIVVENNGKFEIDSIKDSVKQELIRELLENGNKFTLDQSGKDKGKTIMGLLILIILMQTSNLMFLFGEDIEKKYIERILKSPISVINYMLGHCFYSVFIICIINIGVLSIFKIVGVELGYSLGMYALLIFITAVLGTSFSLFIRTRLKNTDSATMLGQVIIIITTLLAGGDNIFKNITQFIPQHAILKINTSNFFSIDFLYVIVFIILLVCLAHKRIKQNYTNS